MKNKTRHFSVAAAGCLTTLFASSCAPKMTMTHVPMSSAHAHADNSLAGSVYAEVNGYRRSIGQGPIPRNAALDRMAQRHSEFMLLNRGKFSLGGKNVSHYGFEERALYAQRAMNMQNVAENVAFGPWTGAGGSAKMIESWRASAGHEVNMKGDWSATGVGVSVDKDGAVFATQIFATKDNSLMTMTNRLKQY